MNKKHAFIFITILLLITIACEVSFGDNGPSEDDINTELTRTSLQQTQTALAQPPAPQPEQQPVADDDDQASPQDNDDDDDDADEDSCYFSRWTGDETIPDGTVLNPGESFVKTWKLRNAGTCDWSTDTRIVFEEGDKLDGPTSIKIDRVVRPGDTYVVEVPMKAPSSDGNYTGVWRFTAADGTKMGKYWVKITVGNPPPSALFAVSGVSFYAGNQPIDLVCPECFDVSAEITVTAAGQVTYTWNDSEGGVESGSITFDAPGKKQIIHSLCVPFNGTGLQSADLYIDNPNHQWFNSPDFDVVCNP